MKELALPGTCPDDIAWWYDVGDPYWDCIGKDDGGQDDWEKLAILGGEPRLERRLSKR